MCPPIPGDSHGELMCPLSKGCSPEVLTYYHVVSDFFKVLPKPSLPHPSIPLSGTMSRQQPCGVGALLRAGKC